VTGRGSDSFTLGGMLFGEGHAATALNEALNRDPPFGAAAPALHALGKGLRGAALRGMADQVARVLDRDVIDLMGAGWRRYEALTSAARRTLATPGAEEIVELADHRITSSHRPRIDVILDEVKLAEIHVEIDVTIDLHAVMAVVFAGRLTALHSGRASVEVALGIEGEPIARATREIELNLELPLGSGIRLVDDSEVLHVGAQQPAVAVP